MDNDLVRMGQEAVVAHFEVLSLVLPGGTEKNIEKLEYEASCHNLNLSGIYWAAMLVRVLRNRNQEWHLLGRHVGSSAP